MRRKIRPRNQHLATRATRVEWAQRDGQMCGLGGHLQNLSEQSQRECCWKNLRAGGCLVCCNWKGPAATIHAVFCTLLWKPHAVADLRCGHHLLGQSPGSGSSYHIPAQHAGKRTSPQTTLRYVSTPRLYLQRARLSFISLHDIGLPFL